MKYTPKLNPSSTARGIIFMLCLTLGFQSLFVLLLSALGVDVYGDGYWLISIITELAILWAGRIVLSTDVNTGVSNKDLGFWEFPTAGRICKLFLLAVGMLLAFVPLANLVSVLLEKIGVSFLGADIAFDSIPDFLLGVVFTAMLPAICEEYFTRGVVLNGLLKKGIWYAILMTGAVFALMHGNLYQTVHQFLLGCVFAYMVLITRNIWYSVILHFFNNFIVICLSLIPLAEESASLDGTTLIVYAVMMILGLWITGALIVSFTKDAILTKVRENPNNSATYVKRKDCKNIFQYVSVTTSWILDLTPDYFCKPDKLTGEPIRDKKYPTPIIFIGAILCLVAQLLLNTFLG